MRHDTRPGPGTASALLGIGVPLVTLAIVLAADWLEGPRTAFVGTLVVVPMLSAVFASARSTALIAAITWWAALLFGLFAEDGGAPAQYIRLGIIAVVGIVAVLAANARSRIQYQLTEARLAAAQAQAAVQEANTDWLTGLLNRRGLDAEFAKRSAGIIIMLDLDGLKSVNDRYGHHVGDDLIRAVAGRIRSCTASRDAVGRWGGDEFVVFADARVEHAPAIARRIEDHVSGEPVHTPAGDVTARVSVGWASLPAEGGIGAALARADEQMYRNKRRPGRSRTSERVSERGLR